MTPPPSPADGPRPGGANGVVPILPRPRLLAMLPHSHAGVSLDDDPNRVSGFTLLLAPAGYGKTALLTEWLRDRDEALIRISCGLGAASDPWQPIARALKALLGDDHHDHPTPGIDGASSQDAALTLAAQLETPVTLVLDDYHRITSPEQDLALADLVQIAPRLTLVVSARRVRILDGPLVTGRAPVTVLDTGDLAFTPDETAALAKLSERAIDARCEEALQLAAGWPLVVRIVLGAEATPVTAHGAPYPELHRFALHSLEIIGEVARRALLATSCIDAVTLQGAAKFIDAGIPQTRSALYELLELGLVVVNNDGLSTEFSCHPAVRDALTARASRSISADQRTMLVTDRAAHIEPGAPFTAFTLLCTHGAYSEAELVLANHFTLITDEGPTALAVIRTLPDEALFALPSFAAARLFLEHDDPRLPQSSMQDLLDRMDRGLQRRLRQPDADAEHGEAAARVKRTSIALAEGLPEALHLPTLAQAMLSARLRGNIAGAHALAMQLEARLIAAGADQPPSTRNDSITPRAATGSHFFYLREIALTAMLVEDFPTQRRNWARLRSQSEELIERPWQGFPPASTRTVTDPESGARWRAAAIGGLALTAAIDGSIREARELLAELDEITPDIIDRAPNTSSHHGDLARAVLAAEYCDHAQLELAAQRLLSSSCRCDSWRPALLVAQAAFQRRSGSAATALADLDSHRSHFTGAAATAGSPWIRTLVHHQARLSAEIGNFAVAERLLGTLPSDHPSTRIERARVALFASNDVQALMLVQQEHERTSVRQQLGRALISAIAAWSCGRLSEALDEFGVACRLIDRHELLSPLSGVPHGELLALAVAATEAGIDAADRTLVHIRAIPEAARAQRRAALTGMEQRTLEAIASHRNINSAAEALFISPATVKKHLHAVYRKLRVSGRDEALLQASRMGLIDEAPGDVPAAETLDLRH